MQNVSVIYKAQKTLKADVLINFKQNCSNDLECISSFCLGVPL